jgi:hypothetical protein
MAASAFPTSSISRSLSTFAPICTNFDYVLSNTFSQGLKPSEV